MANDEDEGTVGDLSLNALWQLAEDDFPRHLGPVPLAAGKIGFFAGASAVLRLLPEVYGIDPRSPAALAAADVIDQWRYEIQTALPCAFRFEPKD